MHTKLERNSDSTKTITSVMEMLQLRIDTFKALYDLAKDDDVPNYNLDVP